MKMYRFYTHLIVFLLSGITFQLSAQVGINTISPSGGAMLDINSTDKGLLIPRMNSVARNLVPSPAAGLLIYDTTTNLFNYFNGSYWYHIDTTFVSFISGKNSPGGGVSVSSLPDKLPDSSAMLDISDPGRGFLLTRTTPDLITAPENGLIIYDISDNLLKYYLDGDWFTLCAFTKMETGVTGSQPSEGVAINVNGAGPHHSAILDVSSVSRGVLIPRLTSLQRDDILPVNGLAIFNTDAKAIEYYNGSEWLRMNIILPVSIIIEANIEEVCEGTGATFTATAVNGGETPLFQWHVNNSPVSGATNAVYSYIPDNDDHITCVLSSSINCVSGNPDTSNVVIMTVHPYLPVSISIVPSANQVCAGTAVTFTATPVNGGTNPAYEWKVNSTIISGATNATFTYNPVNTDAVSCSLISNAVCPSGNPAKSNTVTMMVNPILPVSVSITASENPVCAGTSVTYTASPVNGGTNPSFQWRLNSLPIPEAINATYSYIPVNGNVITCVLTSNAVCPTGNPATSNAISMAVNPLKPVSITISESANTVCAGTVVTFTSSISNGGTSPAYQWMVNGSPVSGATNVSYAYAPIHNDAVTCVLTSNAVCATGNPATSNAVVMVVNPLKPVSIAIVESVNTVCAGTEVSFTSSIVNGGTAPAYQWFVNGTPVSGATNTIYSYAPANNDAVTCVLTSNAICPTGNPDTSNIVIMIVNPLEPVSIAITESVNTICAGTEVTFASSIINGGTSPAYQWVINEIPVSAATNATYAYIPVNNDVVTCVLTSNAICPTGNPATSNAVTMTVNPLLPVSISITPSGNPVCAGTSVTFNSSVNNGGPAPVYQWTVNGLDIAGATDATYTFVPVNDDAITCTVTSNAICPIDNPATSNIVNMTVNPLLPVSISITPSENPVCAGTSVTFNSSVNNGGPGPVYQWTLNGLDIAGATDATYTFVPVNEDAITCIVTSNAICPIDNPATSNVVTMTVNPLLPVSISITPSANPVCAGTSVTFNSSVNNGGTAPVYQWTLNGMDIAGATNTTYAFVPTHNNAITCTVFSNAVCPIDNPATSNVVTMTVNPLLPVSVTILPSANPVCAGTEVTYTATPVNGGSSPQYQWMVNGANVSGATNPTYSYVPVNTNKVKCVLTSSEACAILNPDTSNIITMTVNPLLPVSLTISVSVNPVCATNTVTFTATPVNPGPNPVYQWKVNGTSISGATNATYAYIPVHNDLISCTLTSNATCAVNNPANSTNTITMNVIPLVPVSVLITASLYAVMPGTPVTFTATAVNGGTSPAYQWKVNGTAVAGATNSVYTYTSTNGVDNDLVNCVVTSNLNVPCVSNNPATSNTIVLIIYHTGTPCAGIPTVSYGGQTYNTVQIGTQCWLRENLNIGTRINRTQAQANNGIVEKYCYRDSVKYCNVYGGLYQWGELMQYVTTPGAQGICPTGWRVPTDAQWATLTTYMGGIGVASGKLKESGTTHWANPNVSTNEVGFTALPGGLSSVAGGFSGITRNGQFYTSTQQSSTNAWIVAFTNDYPTVTVLLNYKTTSASVRCLKN